MADIKENTSAVIRQKDPTFPDHLDFTRLRREGLLHIGELSGKIWTDHNVHDPGVTMLEVLCYALMDLGYRTTLPFQDLIAKPDGDTSADDNFLTPLQALTVNPVTITDYRKLLLEIEGVRNAWLIPAEQQEVELSVHPGENKLICRELSIEDLAHIINNTDFLKNNPCLVSFDTQVLTHFLNHLPLHLNGLYHVLLEKETWASDTNIISEARKLLSAHRNLCEDFIDFRILCPEPIGVCAEIDLHPGAKAEAVYAEILKKLRQFIQPEINYYSLQELLDKGKPIEEVFAGRPMLNESVGFVDTEELEGLERQTKIYLSDIYSLVLSVDGVRNIRNLHLKGGNSININSLWTEGICIPEDFVFSFDLDNTCIDLRNDAGLITFNREKIHKSIPTRKKAVMPPDNLDKQPPIGIYHKDLGEYVSIQNEFPVIYGIGLDGLPDGATLQRKAQALQLKGYLLFFDQLLANYLAQLSQLRAFFSMQSEQGRPDAGRHTYFSQNPSELPGIEQLIRYYEQNQSDLTSGNLLATPVKCDTDWKAFIVALGNNPRTELEIANACKPEVEIEDPCKPKPVTINAYEFTSVNLREAYIGRLADAFRDGQYTVEVFQERFGCFYTITVSALEDIVLVSTQRFRSAAEAREQANQTAFIASLTESYTVTSGISRSGNFGHFFEIAYKPLSNLRFLQDVLEDENSYLQRRMQLLNHLMARFSEQFTDFSLLQYTEKKSAQQLRQEQVNASSLFLNNYAEISRNRGKALDYMDEPWNTDNVSGFEKRVSALAGISNAQRRNLCNFEVQPCFKFALHDERGVPVFQSSQSHATREEKLSEARSVLLQLRDRNQYQNLQRKLNGFDSSAAGRLFAKQAAAENILVSKYDYRIELLDRDENIVKISLDTKIESPKAAQLALPKFIANINKQKSGTRAIDALKLVKVGDSNEKWLNIAALPPEIFTHISWKWNMLSADGKTIQSAETIFLESKEAWNDFVAKGLAAPYLLRHDKAWRWRMKLNGMKLLGAAWYPEGGRAQAAWRQAKVFSRDAKNYEIKLLSETKAVLTLLNEKKAILAVSEPFEKEAYKDSELIELAIKAFEDKKARADYDQASGKFGFHIDDEQGNTLLTSYQAYDEIESALQTMGKSYDAGKIETRYLLSGDEGNPEYNFLIKDEFDLFIASPPKTFDTEGDRNTARSALQKMLSAQTAPVQVLEEPRQYSWTFSNCGETILKSDKRSLSEAEARTDYEQSAVKALGTKSGQYHEPHVFQTAIIAEPAAFKFVWFATHAGKPEPLFLSTDTFGHRDLAEKSYETFVTEFPRLLLQVQHSQGKPTGLLLQKAGKKQILAELYRDEKGNAADIPTAQLAHQYVGQVYPDNQEAQDAFIQQSMVMNGNGLYAWRFLKKNDPVAINPTQVFTKRQDAEALKMEICDEIPKFEQDCCKHEPVVICSDVTKKYHFLVRFSDTKDRTFELQGFTGYDTYEEALSAYQKEWYRLIIRAQNRENYGQEGPIRLTEDYTESLEQCDGGTIIALIRKAFTKKWEADGGKIDKIVDIFAELAMIFPVISEIHFDEEGNAEMCYRYAMTNPVYVESNTTPPLPPALIQEIIWQSTECYNSPEAALDAYSDFLPMLGNQNACRVFCTPTYFYVGIVEILAESDCEYATEDEAWGEYAYNLDANGNPIGIKKDECGHCINTGVREFLEAAENPRNFVTFKSGDFWRFMVVSPDYFVAKHTCQYNSQEERNKFCEEWLANLKQLNCENCFPLISSTPNAQTIRIEIATKDGTTKYITSIKELAGSSTEEQEKWVCEVMQALVDCDDNCQSLASCMTGLAVPNDLTYADVLPVAQKYPISVKPNAQTIRVEIIGKDGTTKYITSIKELAGSSTEEQEKWVSEVMKALVDCDGNGQSLASCLTGLAVLDDLTYADVLPVAKKYPIFKGETGYCFRLYWPANDEATPTPLQPCDCKDAKIKYATTTTCTEPYPFESANCYDCLAAAKTAFNRFCMGAQRGEFSVQLDAENDYGPFSFTLIDPSKVIALHPQQYPCRPDVDEAMARAKACLNNEGMQLVEHILLRPRDQRDCDCLLPISPDYCCGIDFVPDYDPDDPCAKPEDLTIHYLPGADPYSFWATVAMPDWNPRFRGSDKRRFMEQLLYQEAPALVGLNILWLSPKQMCKLEDAWKVYLEYLKCPTEQILCSEKPPLCALVDCIKTLCSTDPCDAPADGEGDCNCSKPASSTTNDCCALEDYNGSIFWAECPTPQRQNPSININREILGVELLRSETPVAAPSVPELKKVSKTKAAPATKVDQAKAKKPALDTAAEKTARIRKRPEQYRLNVEAIGDKKLEKTESYKRTLHFLNNPPGIAGYKQLTEFIAEHSLGRKGGASELHYHTLLQNASTYLFDFLASSQTEGLSTAQTKTLTEVLATLREKGFSAVGIASDWNTKDIENADNKKTINQLLKLVRHEK